MAIEIVVPEMGESISEATVATWQKAKGDTVSAGEVLVELETDKVMVEVPAPRAGQLSEVRKEEGETVGVGDVLGLLEEGAAAAASNGAAAGAPQAAAPPPPAGSPPPGGSGGGNAAALGPAARHLSAQHGIDPASVPASGPGGRVTKGDVLHQLQSQPAAPPPTPAAPAVAAAPAAPPVSPAPLPPLRAPGERREERIRMSKLRLRIAERLVQAQQTAAILTTFNEVDMGAVMALRNRYKEDFRQRYGLSIGFMSFFTKACVQALREIPAMNAELEGEELLYKYYYDVGVAVGTERGLVVPVVRDADLRAFIEIELEIARLAEKARSGALSLEDLSGGTFTISNGGIYGSMMSTPILNPPQVGILGMHNIIKRAVVRQDAVQVRPMMYLALSYDHRVIDGRQAVEFLVKVKQRIEDPARLLLEI